MRIFYALLHTVLSVMILVATIYFIQGMGKNLLSPELLTVDDLQLILITIAGYTLISAYFICSTVMLIRTRSNSKNITRRVSISSLFSGLAAGLIMGLFFGLFLGLIGWLITGFIGWLITITILFLILGLILGLIVGLILEKE